MQTNLFEKIVVDNFAGGGGASTGVELAMCRPVDIAIYVNVVYVWAAFVLAYALVIVAACYAGWCLSRD